MLLCPFCRKSVSENAELCPHCDFSLDSLGRILGSPPRLNPYINDFTQTIHPEAQRKIRELVRSNQIHRPNIGFHLVISDILDERLPLSVHGFWFLNRGGICAPVNSGGACYDLLVLINPAKQRAALCAGYAIEYLINQDTLDGVLQSQRDALIKGHYYEVMERIIKLMNDLLDNAVSNNKSAFLPMEKGEHFLPIDGVKKLTQARNKPRTSPY